MKVALIPPRGLENFALQSKFHLALAIEKLMNRKTYSRLYTRATALGDYVVLDNGLAEDMAASSEQIIQYATMTGAQEVVLPDVMRKPTGTITAAKAFLQRDNIPKVKYMAVPQGKKLHEFHQCIEEFAHLEPIKVIGIPRHMIETVDIKPARLDLATWIYEKYGDRFEIHFLGTNPVWLGEVRAAAKYLPFVRSVDTSMPFSYAIAGEDLLTTRKLVTRPAGYFEQDWTARSRAILVRKNIETLMEWAGATGVRSDANMARAEASVSGVREVPA